MKNATIFAQVAAALLLASSSIAETNLHVGMYPYVPEGSDGIERLEEAFEAYCKSKGSDVDVDITLTDTYGDPKKALGFDIAEIDLCVLEALVKDGELPLLDIADLIQLPKTPIGPARRIAEKSWAKKVVPHWVCGNFFVHWEADEALSKAKSFDEILKVLGTPDGRYLYADLWGGGTLGEFYTDAVIDIYGTEYAQKHLTALAAVPEAQVKEHLRADAVLAIWRLTQELDPKHRASKKALHDLTYVYPKTFADEERSALLGYSERMYHVERDSQDEPWDGDKWPLAKDKISVRQFPFGTDSKGTPTWCDAFIVPSHRLTPDKDEAIKLFLEFVMSQDGYRLILEPRPWYPNAYLLPAYREVIDYAKNTDAMPLLSEYADVIDSSFPMFDYGLYIGLDKAGDALKSVLDVNE